MLYQPWKKTARWILTALTVLLCPLPIVAQTPAPINFIQGNYSVPQTPQATVTVAYPAAQSAGNINLVVVGWNDAKATVTSVSDSKGNSYTRAVGPTVRANRATQSIYFAPNISAAAANSNIVTVRFSVAASFPDIRILEYSGLDPVSPLVGGVGATGSSTTTNSGSLTTTVPNVLLVGANVVANLTTGPGAGFTSRMITDPNSDIVEDRVVTTIGSYSATAPQSPSGYWVMQMVAFKAATIGSDTIPPAVAITSHTNNQTVTTSPITVSGTASDSGLGNNGISSVTVNGVAASGGTATGSGTANWSQSVTLNPGANTIAVVAKDASSAQNSTTVQITVTYNPSSPDSTGPAVAITSHINNQTVTTSPITVAGTASDSGLGNNGISSVTVNGVAATGGTAVGSGTANWSRSIALNPGSNTITVVAKDNSTNQNSTTVQITITYNPPSDTAGPALAITSHTNNQTVTTSPITVSGTASDSGLGNNGISSVTVNGVAATGGTAVGSGTANWSRSIALNPGPNTITVVAKDNSTNQNSTTVQITVTYSPTAASIAFVQGNYSVPQTPQATVTVAYTGSQTAGNLNVVAVGWNDGTAAVTSVTDSKGNVYSLAVGPTVLAGQASHAIYYSSNIVAAAANTNVVTVRFNVAAVYPDIRILEYSGLDHVTPLHTVTAATGSSATSNSGSLNVSVPNVLLVAANVVATVTSGPGSGFTNRMITNPNGDIVEDRVVTTAGTYSATAPLTSSGYWVMQMVAFGEAALPPDNTPPTVAITAPLANATVESTITVSASASDNVDVVGVQFFLDGSPLGSEIPDPPYSTLWDTTTAIVGSHTLTARARDAANNSTISAPVSVTVKTTTVADIGQWSAAANWPLVAIHATLLPTGNVLAWDGATQGGAAFIWNPATNSFTSKNPPDNIFCAGHCVLPDGRVFVAGGHIANFVGIRDANIFNSSTNSWSQVRSMAYGRWYPTATMLPDGRVLVVAGDDGCPSCVAAVPEIYDPANNTWVQLPGAQNPLPEYPHLFVLPDGRVLATGTFEEAIPAQVLDINAQTWTVVDPAVVDGHSSVMYGLNKFMKSGTSATSDPPYGPAAATTYVLDMNQAQPVWRETAPMAFPRSYHNLTLLPDGSILATGGEKTTDPFDQTQAVFPAELWSPATETWTTVASLSVPRFYHSIALLLPDGRVLVAGGGRFGGTAVDDMLNAEIYSPPYLFKGTRPVSTSAPNLVSYNSSFSVNTSNAGQIAQVSLLRLGSVTHHFNFDQRYLNLSFQAGSNALTVQAPADSTTALPGYYMLFILDTNGVPSVAKILKLQ
jgi:Domain of unknown function (DUF1929)/Bacterial Ig domain/Glucodextranase, domain B